MTNNESKRQVVGTESDQHSFHKDGRLKYANQVETAANKLARKRREELKNQGQSLKRPASAKGEGE